MGSGPVGDNDHYLGGSEGLKGVFRDEKASEAAEKIPDNVERALEPVESQLGRRAWFCGTKSFEVTRLCTSDPMKRAIKRTDRQ